jgi:cell shape-determining protein MreD
MKSLIRIIPYLVLALLAAAVVPVLSSQILPELKIGLLLPFLLYAAGAETLPVVLILSWLLGIINDLTGFLPSGVSLFTFQIVALITFATSQWITVRSAPGFAVICLPAALINEFLGFLVLSVIAHRPGLSLWALLVMAVATSVWGIAVFLIMEKTWGSIRRTLAKSGLESDS